LAPSSFPKPAAQISAPFEIDRSRRERRLVLGGLALLHALFEATTDDGQTTRPSEDLSARIERADIADFLEAVVSLGREDSIFARLAEAIGGSELEHAADVEAWQTAQGKQHEEL
jgi:hypothetical protein